MVRKKEIHFSSNRWLWILVIKPKSVQSLERWNSLFAILLLRNGILWRLLSCWLKCECLTPQAWIDFVHEIRKCVVFKCFSYNTRVEFRCPQWRLHDNLRFRSRRRRLSHSIIYWLSMSQLPQYCAWGMIIVFRFQIKNCLRLIQHEHQTLNHRRPQIDEKNIRMEESIKSIFWCCWTGNCDLWRNKKICFTKPYQGERETRLIRVRRNKERKIHHHLNSSHPIPIYKLPPKYG